MNSPSKLHPNPTSLIGHRTRYSACLLIVLACAADGLAQKEEVAVNEVSQSVVGPIDLALTCPSRTGQGDQPYRLFLPSAYDGKRKVPLFIAMHGTGGNQNKYFDHPGYGDGIYKREAEKRGIAILCPLGTEERGGSLPWQRATEWRGVGENNVMMAIEDVCQRFLIDEDRIICSGQSMGGSGTHYLCVRYPDLFAAGIPLASTYEHITLMPNLRHVPMFYVQGANDWPIYAQDGPIPLTAELKRLGFDATLWMVPGVGHNTMEVSTEKVLDWALEQRLVKAPKRVTFRAYLPIHGRAYWTEIQEIDEIGNFAEIDAQVEADNQISVALRNTVRAAIRPEPSLLDLAAPITLLVNGQKLFQGECSIQEEIRLVKEGDAWTAAIGPRKPRSRTAYRTHKIGVAVDSPNWEDKAETTMGNWTCDAIRDATGADIAIQTQNHFRGIPFQPGQSIYLVDLINWLRPSERRLVTFDISGADLVKIFELNLLDSPSKRKQFMVHVSGCRYAFDLSAPLGQRITSTDLDPDRIYRVACSSNVLTRTDTLELADLRSKIDFEWHEPTTVSSAWRFIEKSGGKVTSKLEGRIQDVTPSEQRSSASK
ncbi:5'-nucleotidase C-terminal domain-containing protein [Blastopirellula sp. J2-11]|uniref:5'-nucleotidase C-terminal domain-containing protein n=1 Tax=Blastopirellula sp. J2-11 TaxID=2943192 RepID=UPI0021CA7C0B|nr:5'-nucleotidase C-terminal domain-containing protein [Blastopirellula sp. J2-11]UUO09182.1 5'-nucleotidase C-terminal domain-containing protein [Blastopirellula sp. J2-11]